MIFLLFNYNIYISVCLCMIILICPASVVKSYFGRQFDWRILCGGNLLCVYYLHNVYTYTCILYIKLLFQLCVIHPLYLYYTCAVVIISK